MTVLLIEDLPEWSKKIGDALRERGHVVTTATTLNEAEHIVRMLGWKFDLVLADHDVPMFEDEPDNSSTAAIVKYVRLKTPETKIVAISAVHSNNEHLLNVGADFACVKSDLLACVDEVLRRAEGGTGAAT